MKRDEGNPSRVDKAVYHIVIETVGPVEDTEFQVEEVSQITEQVANMLGFEANVWLEEAEYEGGEDA